ncbi:unnamed protein product [Arabidopsis thaliana]|uniref:(thale cress) hypothetical protein n=1 Tax=Arabidopsis thaliana TaxID=3702 RepID=A0A7G2EJ59_ARATH|nr:unnamed protein product [Arabidopsis thaliana]
MASKKPVNRPSVRHASHNHPLRVFKARDEDEVVCSGCELDLTGQAFKCIKSDCDYFLHKSCFELPRETSHKSHPDHPLTLLHSPPYSETYTCDACGEYGSGFTYNCSECQYDLHVGCAFIPETVEREDHEHPLTLLYNTPCKGCEDGAMFIYDEPNNRGGEEGEAMSSAVSRMKSLMKAEDELAAVQLEARIKRDANNAILDRFRNLHSKRIHHLLSRKRRSGIALLGIWEKGLERGDG